MQILPVLDLMHGQVVRGLGGRRHEYRPIVSRLTDSADPVKVAEALRASLGLTDLYLADLDAIMGQEPAYATYRALHQQGFQLWIDAGLRCVERARCLREAEVATIVAGLETLSGPETLAELCLKFGSDNIVFSLDLKAGVTLGNKEGWPSSDPVAIARSAIAAGVRRLLVLDLAHVGGGMGTGTLQLCAQLAAAHPQIRLAAGGGIGSSADMRQLFEAGVQTVLIASALHDGRITRKDLL